MGHWFNAPKGMDDGLAFLQTHLAMKNKRAAQSETHPGGASDTRESSHRCAIITSRANSAVIHSFAYVSLSQCFRSIVWPQLALLIL
jgi:hypothetical protein